MVSGRGLGMTGGNVVKYIIIMIIYFSFWSKNCHEQFIVWDLFLFYPVLTIAAYNYQSILNLKNMHDLKEHTVKINNKIIDKLHEGTLDKLESIPNYSVDMSMVRNMWWSFRIRLWRRKMQFFRIKNVWFIYSQFD